MAGNRKQYLIGIGNKIKVFPDFMRIDYSNYESVGLSK